MRDIEREQWIVAKQMATAVACLNAPFCDSGPAENPEWRRGVAEMIAKECGGRMALDDAIEMLAKARELVK